MVTIDQIDKACARLSALLDELSDPEAKHHARAHLGAIPIYARQAIPIPDEAPVPSGEPETTDH